MLSRAKEWALNVLVVSLVGVAMVGAGIAISQWLLLVRAGIGL